MAGVSTIRPTGQTVGGFTFKLEKKGVLWANGVKVGLTPTTP